MIARGRLMVLALCAGACAGTAGESVDESSLEIVHGAASDASQNAVVLLFDAVDGFECTGTVISANLVLTARHCVSNIGSDALNCDQNGTAVSGGQVGADFRPRDLAVYVGATRASAFPVAAAHGVGIFHDTATNLCNHDLAILQVERNLSAPFATLRLDAGVTTPSSVTVVGWGVTEATQVTKARQARSQVPVLSVGPAVFQGVPVPPSDFLLGESICDGDSGAPAFDSADGALLGIASYGGNGTTYDPKNPATSCVDAGNGVFNTFTSIAPFKTTILQAFAAAGGAPLVEPVAPAAPSSSSGCAIATSTPAGAWLILLAAVIAVLASRLSRRRRLRRG